jgi:hypothetical protein
MHEAVDKAVLPNNLKKTAQLHRKAALEVVLQKKISFTSEAELCQTRPV